MPSLALLFLCLPVFFFFSACSLINGVPREDEFCKKPVAAPESHSPFMAGKEDAAPAQPLPRKPDADISGRKILSPPSPAAVKETNPAEAAPAPEKSEPALEPADKEAKSAQQLLDEALESYQTAQESWEKRDAGKAVEALDQAYSLILQADPGEDQDLLQQKEDIRLLICKQMLAVYRTQAAPPAQRQKAIPLIVNGYVEREIHSFKGPERNFFIQAYRTSGRYRPEILRSLEKAGLPAELSWLPLIESGYKAEALSPSRALGLWQFIPSTGYKFGLKRDRWVDERMDAPKSTRAAIAYLQELHEIFGDWLTVLAAYNCGEGRVLNVIRNQPRNYLDNFWDLFEKLPRETARYVPRFIATLLIVNDPQKYGFSLEAPDCAPAYETITVKKQVLLAEIAKNLNVPGETLENLNPELRLKMTPAGPYELRVPEGAGNLLLSRIDGIPECKIKEGKTLSAAYVSHRVRRGDTLSSLAARYHTTVRAIAALNDLKKKDSLRIGQVLKIPANKKTALAAR
jgi:membrane-bound lytic murein transglycosylase D